MTTAASEPTGPNCNCPSGQTTFSSAQPLAAREILHMPEKLAMNTNLVMVSLLEYCVHHQQQPHDAQEPCKRPPVANAEEIERNVNKSHH